MEKYDLYGLKRERERERESFIFGYTGEKYVESLGF